MPGSAVVYLDESGDLGWKFDAPYRRGGSSRFLTISALCVLADKKHLPKRVVRNLYDKFKWHDSIGILDRMAQFDVVTMVPDPRSIRVKSGNSLHDYLQTELWFEKKAATNLITSPADSATSLAVQFADMLAGTVQARFEHNSTSGFQVIQPRLRLVQLFF